MAKRFHEYLEVSELGAARGRNGPWPVGAKLRREKALAKIRCANLLHACSIALFSELMMHPSIHHPSTRPFPDFRSIHPTTLNATSRRQHRRRRRRRPTCIPNPLPPAPSHHHLSLPPSSDTFPTPIAFAYISLCCSTFVTRSLASMHFYSLFFVSISPQWRIRTKKLCSS